MALGSGMMFLECIQGLFLDGGISGDIFKFTVTHIFLHFLTFSFKQERNIIFTKTIIE